MNYNRRILLIDNVINLSRTNVRPRERQEIDTILESKKYHPYMIYTDPVLIYNSRQLKTKTFFDNRIETYRVPNLAIGSLSSNRKLGKIGKLMFGFCNIFLQLIYFLHLTALILSLVLTKNIQLMHAHNPPDFTGLASLFVSKITKVPYIFEIHDRTPEVYCGEMGFEESSLIFKIMKTIEKLVIINSKGVITVNEHVATYFKQYGGPTPIAIYTGSRIGASIYGKFSTKKRKLINSRIILYQGSLSMTSVGKPAMYDLELPLNAMPIILKSFPNTSLVYVGEGSGRLKLEEKSRSLGLENKVIFTGFVSQEKVFDWIGKADVVLIPYADNPNNHTTVPSKLYEYMAVGKPIVATRFPGILEILEHERNGILYTVGSIKNFSQCVLRLLNDLELAEKLSLNAQMDFTSKYSPKKNWGKLISLYDSILV